MLSAAVARSLGAVGRGARRACSSAAVPQQQHNTPPFGWIETAPAVITEGSMLPVEGWAADAEDGAPVTRVTISVDGNAAGEASVGFPRPDIAIALRNPQLLTTGWKFSISPALLPPG